GNLIAPRRTEINGGRVGRAIVVRPLVSGSLRFENLTFREGFLRALPGRGAEGAGMHARVDGGQLVLRWVHLVTNIVAADQGGSAESGGAGALVLVGGGTVLIEQTHFEDNVLTRSPTTTLSCRGAGLNIQVTGGTATIRNTTFLRNFAGGQVSIGGGMHALV